MAVSEHLHKRVLHAWDLDARQSFAALGRKVGISADSARRIIHDYEADGTIAGYITVVDIGRLGYMGFGVYARLDTADPKKQQRLLAYLRSRVEIYWIAHLGGRYDLLFAIQSPSLPHFAEVLSEIQRRFSFVTNVQFAIRTRATQFQRSYLSEKSLTRANGGFEFSEHRETITARERRVLELLIESPRLPIVELARRTKITRITAQAILKRLEERRIIQRFSALVDCKKLGRESHLVQVTLKRFDQATRAAIRRFVTQESAIIFSIETIGPWQSEFHCEVPSQQELQDLLRRFRSQFADVVSGLEVIAGLNYYDVYRYRLL